MLGYFTYNCFFLKLNDDAGLSNNLECNITRIKEKVYFDEFNFLYLLFFLVYFDGDKDQL